MVADGVHITAACSATGLPRSTLYLWLDRARVAEKRPSGDASLDEHDLACLAFAERLERARALGELKAVSVVMAAACGSST